MTIQLRPLAHIIPLDRFLRHRECRTALLSFDNPGHYHQRSRVCQAIKVQSTLTISHTSSRIPARIIPPFFADKFGPLNTVVPVLFCVAIVSYTWLAVDSTTGFYIFTVFYGMINASFQCLIPTAVASLTPNLNVVGTRLGMAFATISFAALTGP